MFLLPEDDIWYWGGLFFFVFFDDNIRGWEGFFWIGGFECVC